MQHLIALLLCVFCGSTTANAFSPAFYYGTSPFPQELRVFDTWIVEPAQFLKDPTFIRQHQDKIFAYVSLGEVDAKRPYLSRLPDAWLAGENKTWKSRVIDQSAAAWPEFFVDEVIGPLREQGYHHFFLDTLDSYHLIATTPEARRQQEQGMIRAIRLLKSRYPDARLILNRGFEILPQIKELVTAVAAESLFQSWNNRSRRYESVNEADRAWLSKQLVQVRDELGLPVIVIDYVAPENRERAREVAAKIKAYGFIPWVSDGGLGTVGTGMLDPQPRRILMLYDENPEGDALKNSDMHRFAAMPINHLGYVPEYRNLRTDGLPEAPLAGRYAGIVTWFRTSEVSRSAALAGWLAKQLDDGMPLAVLGFFGFEFDGSTEARFGLASGPRSGSSKVSVIYRKPEAAFEVSPLPTGEAFLPLSAGQAADVWLRTGDGKRTQDAVAIMPWGGYALAPFVVSGLQVGEHANARWVIDPIAFFRQALKLPDMPVPDVTTENGRRLLIAHVDGDGFASKAEFPGAPWAADVLYREILQRYRIPTTVSVIQGETSKDGMYPQFAAQQEAIARKIFALPHVEAASHSFSHPFRWQALAQEGDGEGYNLHIPGYVYDEAREIDGSVAYVESLLPAGKRCHIFLWTGDCNPAKSTLARSDQAGLLNMNGGETRMSRMHPTLTAVAPLGIPRDGHFQIYAPNQNENVYTNLWTGPFYGYERVIETFEMTETPLRLKPIDIYYHTYSASKPASLKALKKVYDWALSQPVLPLPASDYIRKVLDFNTLAIAREGDGWRIAGGDAVRTLRIPQRMGYPDLARSRNVLGWWDEGKARYVHLGGAPTSLLVLANTLPSRPWIARANGRIDADPAGWTLTAAAPLEVEFGGTDRCSLLLDGKPAPLAQRPAGYATLKTAARSARIEVRCAR